MVKADTLWLGTPSGERNSGERRVTFGDKTVEYRWIEELRLAIGDVKRGLFEQATQTGLWPRAPRQIRMTTSKGS